MNTTSAASIRHFNYSHQNIWPQIPKVQHVLRFLRLILGVPETTDVIPEIVARGPIYRGNIQMLIDDDQLLKKVLNALSERKVRRARKIIAHAIVERCPIDARCMFKDDYTQAVRESGKALPEPCAVCRACLRRAS